ncbi:hypothetical protein [Streptomyces sp. NPDC054961]
MGCRARRHQGRVTDDLRSRLDDARREHRARYSEAQMRVPDDALAAADDVHRRLNGMYGVLKRLDGGIPPRREGESLEQTHTHIMGLWKQLQEMRRTMRRSIGIPAHGLSDRADDTVRTGTPGP